MVVVEGGLFIVLLAIAVVAALAVAGIVIFIAIFFTHRSGRA